LDIERKRNQNRASYYRNREKRLNYTKEYQRKNKKKRKKYLEKYYLKHKDKINLKSHLYWEKNKVKLNKQRNEFRRLLREKAIKMLGNKCIRCGFSDIRALCFDHIHGGGTKEARCKYIQARQIAHIIVTRPKEEWQDKYQLLCANCNFIKKLENDEVRRVYRGDDNL